MLGAVTALMICMLPVSIRSIALPTFALFALSTSACSLVPIEVTADGKLQFEVRGETTSYSDIETYDPNENEDYLRYKDQFEAGEIDSILISVLRVQPGNQATWVAGQVDVREHTESNDGEWTEGVSSWGGLRLMGEQQPNGTQEPLQDEIYLNPALSDNYNELNRVVFKGAKGPIDLRVQGVADSGPVEFDLEVTVTFTVNN